MNVVEVVSAAPGTGFLTPQSGDRVATLRGFVTANADVYGLAGSVIAELQVVADYMNPAGNMGWAELEQRINGIPVFQGLIRGGFTARGELARTTGALATVADATALLDRAPASARRRPFRWPRPASVGTSPNAR